MELSTLFYFIALLACPIGMGTMMWMMGKSKGGQKESALPDGQMTGKPTDARLAALRARRQALEAEIAEVTELVELETRRKDLYKERALAVDKTDSANMVEALMTDASDHR